MALRDLAAMNASLDNDYGPDRGPNAAEVHELALWVGDPTDEDSHELDETGAPGYARVTIAAEEWAAAEDGAKSTTAPIEFPPPTDEWVEEPTHWQLIDLDGTGWDYAELVDPLIVTSASTAGPQVSPVIYFTAALLDD